MAKVQIHELNDHVGEVSESEYLAIDNGTNTTRIPATAVGITTEITVAEIETGTEEEPRVVAPNIFKQAVNAIMNPIIASLADLYVSITNPKYVLDVVVSESTGRATSGEDKDLYNALVDLGWVSDVIETE